jgi:hypothetical protein
MANTRNGDVYFELSIDCKGKFAVPQESSAERQCVGAFFVAVRDNHRAQVQFQPRVLVTGDERDAQKGNGQGIQDLVFSPKDKILTFGDGDGTIRLWASDAEAPCCFRG